MAPAKRKTNTAPRTRKRTAAKKGNHSSSSSMLALGAIVALGAGSLWAVSQDKSPQTAISGLFNRNSVNSHAPEPVRRPSFARVENQSAQSSNPAPSNLKNQDPTPRPSVGLTQPKTSAPVPAASPVMPRHENAKNMVPLTKPNQIVASAPTSTAVTKNLPPRGENRAGSTPTLVYAKQKLTVRKNAWDKSPSMGEIEQGRELRSYGQTGKWHRVVVPATDMIGWVHEDQLKIVKKTADKAAKESAPLTTGSIQPVKPVKATITASKPIVSHPIPQRSVGSQ